MAGPLALEAIVAASLKGVVHAQKSYCKWSDEWPWCAPEYLTTVFVARELGKLRGAKFISLENKALSAIKDAGAKGRGKLHSAIRANGKFDILLWWSNGTPRAPIEVKCQVLRIAKIRADVERVSKVIGRKAANSTMGFGVIVFYSSCRDNPEFTAKERLEKCLENLLRDARDISGPSCHVALQYVPVVSEGESAWTAAALVLRPKSS